MVVRMEEMSLRDKKVSRAVGSVDEWGGRGKGGEGRQRRRER